MTHTSMAVYAQPAPNAPVEAGISAASAAHLGNLEQRKDGVAHWDAEVQKES